MKTSYSVIAILLISIVTLALSHTESSADNDKNNRYGIDNDCYHLYEEALKVRSVSRERASILLDSMFYLAKQRSDTKAQCIALTGHVNNSDDVEEAISKIDTLRNFAIKTPYKQYVFGGWGSIIKTYIRTQKYAEAFSEIRKYQEKAVELDNSYGMARSHLLMSDLYDAIDNYTAAIQEVKQGLRITLQRGNKNEAYSYYQQLSKFYFNNKEIDSATLYANRVLNEKMALPLARETAYYILGRIAARDDKATELYKQINNIELLYRDYPNDQLKARYLIELHAAYASEIKHDKQQALAWANKNKETLPKLQMQEEIYAFHNDFENAFKTKKELDALKNRYSINHISQQLLVLNYIIESKELDYEKRQSELYNSQLALQQSRQQQQLASTRLHLVQAENRKHIVAEHNRKIQQTNALLQQKEQMARIKISTAQAEKAKAQAEAQTLQMQQSSTLVISLFSVLILIIIAALIYIYRRNTYAAVVNKEMQHLRSETQLKDNLIKGIKEDIQTPLNQIISNIQHLSHPKSNAEISTATTQIHQATEKITTVIDQLSKI